MTRNPFQEAEPEDGSEKAATKATKVRSIVKKGEVNMIVLATGTVSAESATHTDTMAMFAMTQQDPFADRLPIEG